MDERVSDAPTVASQSGRSMHLAQDRALADAAEVPGPTLCRSGCRVRKRVGSYAATSLPDARQSQQRQSRGFRATKVRRAHRRAQNQNRRNDHGPDCHPPGRRLVVDKNDDAVPIDQQRGQRKAAHRRFACSECRRSRCPASGRNAWWSCGRRLCRHHRGCTEESALSADPAACAARPQARHRSRARTRA